MTMKNFWIKYKPYLDAYFDLGFFRFKTVLMHEAFEMDTYEIIHIQWRFFKWEGKFSLYEPGNAREERKELRKWAKGLNILEHDLREKANKLSVIEKKMSVIEKKMGMKDV